MQHSSIKRHFFQQKSLPDINAFKPIHTPSPGRGTAHPERLGQLLSKRKICSFHSKAQIPCKLLFVLISRKNSLQVFIKPKYVCVQFAKIPAPNTGHLIRDGFLNFQ